jgi:hypothetical protein
MKSSAESEVKYWQGVMDGIGIALWDDKEKIDSVRREWAKVVHVCYSSLLGPYCVICHRNIPPPYTPIWSDE